MVSVYTREVVVTMKFEYVVLELGVHDRDRANLDASVVSRVHS